jgi:DNA-3-methyladenine glycosylase
VAGAVLVRALRPLEGIAEMAARRGGRALRELCNGPGKLAAALGVDLSDNGSTLGRGRISVYYGERPAGGDVAVSGRIGLSTGHDLELRFYLAHEPFVSRGRPGPLRPKRRTTAR